jgi:hypothetical protein
VKYNIARVKIFWRQVSRTIRQVLSTMVGTFWEVTRIPKARKRKKTKMRRTSRQAR